MRPRVSLKKPGPVFFVAKKLYSSDSKIGEFLFPNVLLTSGRIDSI